MRQTQTQEQLAYNLKNGAKIIGVSVPTLSKMLDDGILPHKKYGKRRIIPRQAILDWLTSEGQK
jgi:excisionase family DNA binding protein